MASGVKSIGHLVGVLLFEMPKQSPNGLSTSAGLGKAKKSQGSFLGTLGPRTPCPCAERGPTTDLKDRAQT